MSDPTRRGPVCCLVLLMLATAVLPHAAGAQDDPEPQEEPAARLKVAEMVIAHGYDPEARRPVEPATAFAADVGKIYCFTRITGAEEPTSVVHAWYHEGKTMAKVTLAVGAASWRTYSSKNVLPAWTGRWEVKVLDDTDAVLAAMSFTVE
jgi:hypothetical protein